MSLISERFASASNGAELKAIKAQRDELAAALKAMTDEYAKSMQDAGVTHYPETLFKVRQARAVLAKIEQGSDAK